MSGTTRAPALLTDLYQLTMLDAYHQLGMNEPAVFEFFVRRLPSSRNFLVAAGLEQVLDYLENLRFTAAELEWLASTQQLSASFLERLAALRFTGDVYAMREGTVFFASEPVLRVVAPLPQAQLIESRIVNLLHHQTLVASKAVRCRLAAPEADLIDFGMRPRGRSGVSVQSRQLHRRIRCDSDSRGSASVRHSRRRNHGAFLRSGPRTGARGLPQFCDLPPRQCGVADRHVRYRQGCAAGGRTGKGAEAQRHRSIRRAHRQW